VADLRSLVGEDNVYLTGGAAGHGHAGAQGQAGAA
jgi:hypothetical protein